MIDIGSWWCPGYSQGDIGWQSESYSLWIPVPLKNGRSLLSIQGALNDQSMPFILRGSGHSQSELLLMEVPLWLLLIICYFTCRRKWALPSEVLGMSIRAPFSMMVSDISNSGEEENKSWKMKVWKKNAALDMNSPKRDQEFSED